MWVACRCCWEHRRGPGPAAESLARPQRPLSRRLSPIPPGSARNRAETPSVARQLLGPAQRKRSRSEHRSQKIFLSKNAWTLLPPRRPFVIAPYGTPARPPSYSTIPFSRTWPPAAHSSRLVDSASLWLAPLRQGGKIIGV